MNTGRNGDKIDQGSVWSAALDPAGSGTLYVITGYGPAGVWKSTNGGVDWDNVLPTNQGMPGFVARVAMNPNNPLHHRSTSSSALRWDVATTAALAHQALIPASSGSQRTRSQPL